MVASTVNPERGARREGLHPLAFAAAGPFLMAAVAPDEFGLLLIVTVACVMTAAGLSRSCATLCVTSFAGAFGLNAGYAAREAFVDGELYSAMVLPLSTLVVGLLLFPIAMIGGAIGWGLTPSASKEQERDLPPSELDSTCPWCGALTASDNIRCRSCGRWLPEPPSSAQTTRPLPGRSVF